LDHPNIIKLYETYEDQSTIYMVLELATGGELYDHLIDADHYSEKEAAEYFYHMCQSINYCHNHDICHRDLKLENFIFENVSENAQLKLIDFGLSRKYSKNAGPKRMASIVGTAYYMAPEVLKRGGYTNKCDMWGLGAILYMMLSGRPPFDGESDRQIMEAVRLGKYEFGLEWSRVSPDAKNLVRRLLEMDPKKRISAEQCLAHPWLTKRAQMSKSPLSANVVESLKTFGKMNKLKQTAIDVIAFSLTQNQMKHLREAFKSMDKDNSGVIGIEEFHHALSDSGTSKAEIDELFTAIDRDGGGTISYSEFVAATVSRQNYLTEERLRAAFDRLDVDKTGDISLTDLKAVMGDMYNEDALKAMIGQADIHDDGKIHYEEFLEIMHRMNDG
jgi:calcium-dependent protein kinase